MRNARSIVAVSFAVIALAFGRELFDLVRMDVKSRQDVRMLEQAGCVVNGPGPDGRLLVEVPATMRPALEQQGYSLETVMPDIYGFYEKNAQDARFHTYTQIRDTFILMAQNNPEFVRFETLGFASNDSLMFALKITDNPDVEEDEPELMFEAAAHGDEKCATEPIFEWAAYLIRSYGVDPQVTYWVNTREIWVSCPTNPYGHIVGVRNNRNGYDCNRDYGYMWYYETSAREGFTQPETRAHARLIGRNAFSFWQSGHGGTYCISTPWSYAPYGTRDSIEIQHMALQYHNIVGYEYGPGYRVMYQINGASKDYAYGALGAIGWTIETCIYKTPPVESLNQIIQREHTAMKMVLANIDRGVRGIVTDSVTGAPIRARVVPMPVDFPSYCDSIGDYHRYLRPGTYTMVFDANGYEPRSVAGVVVTADTATWLNVTLAPDTTEPVTLHRLMAGRGVSDVNIASTPDWAFGEHDGRRFSMGRGGMAIFDFSRQVVNSSGNDFTVYEDDADPEGYRIDVANDWLGPWTSLGYDTGTAGFDLTRGGVSTCRYLRVTDDSGATSGATAGFDLDAIEAIVSNAAALVFHDKTMVDSPPGGNGDGRLDRGETADLVVALKNVGRRSVDSLAATLLTADTLVTVVDSTGSYGTVSPDSVVTNRSDRFRVTAAVSCPPEYTATMKLLLDGTGYSDSLEFTITVGELLATDPIPDGPRQPPLYYAYDDVDTSYWQHPSYEWVEIRGLGTRLTLSDDQTVVVSLPSGFGPFRYYGQNYTQVSICGNGWVAPGSTTQSNYSNNPLPDPGMPAFMPLNWDDLYPPQGGGVWYYHDVANHRFVVEFDSVPYYANRSVFEKNQVILYDTTSAAGDGNCRFRYQYKTAGDMTSTTVGMQDPSRQIGIMVLHNGARHRAAAPLVPGRAILYTTDWMHAVEERPAGPAVSSAALHVSPNPWSRGRLVLSLQLVRPGPARVAAYDASGRLVGVLLDSGSEPLHAGTHRFSFSGNLAAGIYVIRMEHTDCVASAKLVRAF